MEQRLGFNALQMLSEGDNTRLIAMVDPGAVRQTSEAVQSCVVRGIDSVSFDTPMFLVEVKNKNNVDQFVVPLHSIRSFLVVEKKYKYVAVFNCWPKSNPEDVQVISIEMEDNNNIDLTLAYAKVRKALVESNPTMTWFTAHVETKQVRREE